MKILIDAGYLPNSIITIASNLAQDSEINFEILRNREEDIYKKKSQDFENEVAKKYSFERLEPIIEKLTPSDLLITDDFRLAELAVNRVTAILDSKGQILTPDHLEINNINQELARLQGRFYQTAKTIKHRDPADDVNFRQTLINFLSNI